MDQETYSEYLTIIKVKHPGKIVLTRKETAEMLQIGLSTLDLRIKEAKDLPKYKKCGGRVFFPIVEIAKYLAADLIQVA